MKEFKSIKELENMNANDIVKDLYVIGKLEQTQAIVKLIEYFMEKKGFFDINKSFQNRKVYRIWNREIQEELIKTLKGET